MKSIFLILKLVLLTTWLHAQEVEIHHVNVGDGDATVIALRNKDGTYGSKILIDGGRANGGEYLVPYVKNVFGNTHFTYIILTHYHDDHYNGLAQLKEGTISADTLIDPGGYTLDETEPVSPNSLKKINPPNAAKGEELNIKRSTAWQKVVKTYWHKFNPAFARSAVLSDFPADIGNTAIVGRLDGVPVTLTCVAAMGYTLREHGEVSDDNPARKENANNTSLAFVLQFGSFRYFTGGDMAGKKTSAYADQETPLCGGLKHLFPRALSWNKKENAAGHICAFKASHHGSDHSTNTLFLQTLRPAACFTSAGTNQSWHLPSVGFIMRIAASGPLSAHHSKSRFNQGFYFTTLMDFEGEKNKSLSEAESLLGKRPWTDFRYSHVKSDAAKSFVLVVKAKGIKKESEFRVYEVSATGIYTLPGKFECHRN